MDTAAQTQNGGKNVDKSAEHLPFWRRMARAISL
jgi:hypothetical protein